MFIKHCVHTTHLMRTQNLEATTKCSWELNLPCFTDLSDFKRSASSPAGHPWEHSFPQTQKPESRGCCELVKPCKTQHACPKAAFAATPITFPTDFQRSQMHTLYPSGPQPQLSDALCICRAPQALKFCSSSKSTGWYWSSHAY